MFRFATDGRVRWPLSIDQVQDDGATQAQGFGVVFTILTRDELRERDQALHAYNRTLRGLYPAEGEPDTDELAAQRWALTEKRVGEDDALLRQRITGWDSIADQDGNAIEFSPTVLDALLANPLMRQVLLGGLIDASLGAPAKNSQPGLAGMPARAQA
ncbi:hypothetical protein [Dyella sp.]|uniref:hypothetical protein n=1 Tax=Dyella sp. TaxID=1869338 RepID=UPI003F7DBCA5